MQINGGKVRVSLNKERLSVVSDKVGGTLIWKNKKYEIIPNVELLL